MAPKAWAFPARAPPRGIRVQAPRRLADFRGDGNASLPPAARASGRHLAPGVAAPERAAREGHCRNRERAGRAGREEGVRRGACFGTRAALRTAGVLSLHRRERDDALRRLARKGARGLPQERAAGDDGLRHAGRSVELLRRRTEPRQEAGAAAVLRHLPAAARVSGHVERRLALGRLGAGPAMASRIFSLLIVLVAAALLWPLWQHQRALREKAYAELEREQAEQAAPAEEPNATQSAGPASEEAEAAPRAAQSYYRFIDQTGTLRFVDSLDKVPEAYRASARPITMGAGSSHSGSSSYSVADASRAAKPARRPFSDGAGAPPAHRGRANAEVVVYSTSWCPWCRKTM